MIDEHLSILMCLVRSGAGKGEGSLREWNRFDLMDRIFLIMLLVASTRGRMTMKAFGLMSRVMSLWSYARGLLNIVAWGGSLAKPGPS